MQQCNFLPKKVYECSSGTEITLIIAVGGKVNYMSDKKYDVLSFGEAMVRLTAPDHERLEQANFLNLAISAAELSVAVNISNLGLRTSWISKLVDTWSGRYIIERARGQGVDMSNVITVPFDGVGWTRNGLCFIEIGIGPRASRMLYDRGYSAISKIQPGEIEWEKIMSQTSWFHTTGISTALSENVANEVIVALKIAKKFRVKTSFDLNFRSTLWNSEKAKEVIKQVMPYIDVLIGNEEDFEKCLGITAEGTTENYSNINPLGYEAVARKLIQAYPNIELVGTTLRNAKTALLNDWQTAILYKGKYYLSRKYENLEIMDRIGGGDSFASALIYCCIVGKEAQEIIDFSAAYSALCHGFMGDWNWATREEAENVMKGGSARIKR